MRSPFPGMDPFLEDPAFWEDFHRRFIAELADYLLQRLPDTYDARMDERVRLVEAESGPSAVRLPDVSVDWAPSPRLAGAPPAHSDTVATLEPVTLPMAALEEVRDVWIEIYHLPERSLVTAIEVLSPSNKQGNDSAEYHNKRIDFYTRKVNLVEIDLLRGGNRLRLGKPLPLADYYVYVTRAGSATVDLFRWMLRDALPNMPVPLKREDGNVIVELSAVFASAYERGRYSRRLRYDREIDPPFRSEDQAWINTHLRAASTQ